MFEIQGLAIINGGELPRNHAVCAAVTALENRVTALDRKAGPPSEYLCYRICDVTSLDELVDPLFDTRQRNGRLESWSPASAEAHAC
jgi:hypothetical protein